MDTKPKISRHCLDCGAALVIRTNRETKTEFLGCSKYPECRYTEPLPEDVKLRASGMPGLFDYENF